MGRLIPLTSAGAIQAKTSLDALRQYALDGHHLLEPVPGLLCIDADGFGVIPGDGAAHMGMTDEQFAALAARGDIRPLPLPRSAGIRYSIASLDAFVSSLKPLEITNEVRERADPSVEEYQGAAAEPGIVDGWSEGMRHTEARDAAALSRDDADFAQYLREQHFPEPKLTDVGEGVQQFDPNGALSPEQVADQRRAWHKRRQAAAEAEKYDGITRRLRLG